MQIDHVSTIVIRNKLNLFTRLMRNKHTSELILSLLQDELKYPSFVTDIYNITMQLDIDFYKLLINKKYPKIYSYYDEIPEEHENNLFECFHFWNISNGRKRFASIMEEKIPNRNN